MLAPGCFVQRMKALEAAPTELWWLLGAVIAGHFGAREAHPDLMLSLSCEVDPAFREYERTCITAFDAYVKPVIDRYLELKARARL